MIEDFLVDEQWIVTGTSAYDLPDYEPKDVDICILSEGFDAYRRITASLKEFANLLKVPAIVIDRYKLEFWGERTFNKVKIKNYYFFLVSKETFDCVEITTECLEHQPEKVKKLMAKNKKFRVDLFKLIMKHYDRMSQDT